MNIRRISLDERVARGFCAVLECPNLVMKREDVRVCEAHFREIIAHKERLLISVETARVFIRDLTALSHKYQIVISGDEEMWIEPLAGRLGGYVCEHQGTRANGLWLPHEIGWSDEGPAMDRGYASDGRTPVIDRI